MKLSNSLSKNFIPCSLGADYTTVLRKKNQKRSLNIMSIHVLTPVQTPLTIIPTAPCRFPDGSTGRRAASLNQLRWKVVLLICAPLCLYLLHQHFTGGLSKCGSRLTDRGQRDIHHHRHRVVIKTDQRHVLRDAQAQLSGRPPDAERHVIVPCEDSGHSQPQKAFSTFIS